MKGLARGAFAVLLAVLFGGCLTNHHAEGLKLMEAGRMPEAWEAFEKGYEADPDSPYSLNNMGYVLEMRDGDLIEAARFYRKAIRACEAREGDPELDRLEEIARDNLERVVYKLQWNPRLQVDGRFRLQAESAFV